MNATGVSRIPVNVWSLARTWIEPTMLDVMTWLPVRPCHFSIASDRRANASFSWPLGRTPSVEGESEGHDLLLVWVSTFPTQRCAAKAGHDITIVLQSIE